MAEIIALIILIISILGLSLIVYKKLPELLVQSENPLEKVKFKDKLLNLKESWLNKNFTFDNFLQKVLSKFRVLTLRTENKTSCWLEQLREKSKKKKEEDPEDSYWEDIKNSTK